MRNSERDRRRQMEREDELGISRQKNREPLINLKVYKILKISFIVAIPVVYFMCSPALIAVMAAWVVLLIITCSLEKSYNAGLKKELQTRFPKTDCILCIIIIVLTGICIAVSEVSSSSHSYDFDGMSSSEISSALKNSGSMTWHKIENILKNIGSCMTGTRYLFQSEMSYMHNSSDDVAEAPSGSSDISSMLSDMPFSMIFESIIKAVCTALLLVVVILGILALRKLKKLGVNDAVISDKERRRRLKKEEERIKKERAKRNYYSVKKSDFSQMEQDIIQDLAFLFDDEDTEDDNHEENTDDS